MGGLGFLMLALFRNSYSPVVSFGVLFKGHLRKYFSGFVNIKLLIPRGGGYAAQQ